MKKRGKPVIGSQVAKELLRALRELREWEARQGASGMLYKTTEEIEAWEDLIRERVKGWRSAPREVLHLDAETTAALDETCGMNKPGYGRTDAAKEHRRTFALRAIKAVCQSWVNGDRPSSLAVTLREMTDDEKAAELLAMQGELQTRKERARQ